jgi:hypothetical protein
MLSAAVATLGRPDWWAMALAAFLVRGGALLIVFPIVALPTLAGLITAYAPFVEGLVLGRPSVEGAVIGSLVMGAIAASLLFALLAGSWLDLALIRDAVGDDELELGWAPDRGSADQALMIRLVAHLPTLAALSYAAIRVVTVSYQELTSPGETGGAGVIDRIIGRTPDALIVVVVAWLFAEAIGPLAARRVARGARATPAVVAAARQVLAPRGLATLALTSAVLAGFLVPFILATGRAWQHLRAYLHNGADALSLGSAVVVLVATWVLGLIVVGAALAWRATAWTAELSTD